jgi:hypothetical protein
MKRLLLLKSLFLLCALVVGTNAWADDYTLQLSNSKKFSSTGLTDGSISWSATNNSATIGSWNSSDYKGQQFGTGNTKGNVVLSTSSISGTITQVDVYSQTGISGGATVAVSVGGTSFGSQSMKVPSATGEDPGKLSFTGSKTGTVQITLTQTVKKAMYLNKIVITYTPSSTPSSGASFASETPSIDWPTNPTYTQTATTASGYSTTAGASVTYSIGSTNTCEATINASTGEVTPTKGGSVQVVATAAAIEGHFTQSSASYTLTVNDVRETPTLSWSSYSVEIFKDADSYTLPTLNNPNSLDVTYSVTGTDGLASVTPAGVVTVNTGTVGTATVKATFEGNSTYKARTASYTINVVDPTVKGSKYNPYTVAEVIAENPGNTASQTDVYVKGYIVGCYNTSSQFTTTSSQFQASNIALADDPDDTSANIPVQMPSSGAIRTGFNVVDNPGHIGVTQVLLKGDIIKYFGKPGVKNLDEMTKCGERITVTSFGWATYIPNYDIEFPANTAYVVTAASVSTGLTLEAVTQVPASTPLLLKGEGAKTAIVLDAAPAAPSTNLLSISDGSALATGKYAYVLAKNGASACFKQWTGAMSTLNGRVMLVLDEAVATARAMFDLDENDVTAIEAVKTNNVENGQFFNLAGQRVAQPTKGLYIVNGKKVVIK